jgi:hypothetical protein
LKRRYWALIALLGGIALAITPLFFIVGQWRSLLGRTVQNFGHLPLFCVIATLLLLVMFYGSNTRLGPVSEYGVALALGLLCGFLTEFAQIRGPRNADLVDLVRNGAGVFIALVWWATFDRRLDGSVIRRARARVMVRCAAVALGLVFMVPLIGVAGAYLDRGERFPVLFSFEERSEEKFILTRLAAFEFVPPPDAWSTDPPPRVARLSFAGLNGGAVVFHEPVADWSAHTALTFELFHPGEEPIEVGIRVDDVEKAFLYKDRYNRWLVLDPGVNKFRIPLEEIASGPTDRRLDLTSIDRFLVFAVDPVGGYEVYLGPVALD